MDEDIDERRFRDLWASTHADVVRFVARRAGPEHGEDVAAETFLTAWRRLDSVPEGPSEARAWLFATARHLLLNTERGDRRRQALGVRIAGLHDDAHLGEMDPELLALRADLHEAWPRLTDAHQEALSLSAWEGLNAGEAAEVLGISPVAYRLRLSRARRALRVHLQLVIPHAHDDRVSGRTAP